MRPCRLGPGFTLVELLVVIAVIGLLITLILPALSRAKEQSSRVACANQLRQITIAVLNYAVQNEGVLPSGKRDNGGEHCPWISSRMYDVMIDMVGVTSRKTIAYEDRDRMVEPILQCTNFPASGPGIYATGSGWVIGYLYLGSHPSISGRASSGVEAWDSPLFSSDDPSSPLWSDWNARTKDGYDWTVAPHGANGSALPSPYIVYTGSQTPEEVGAEGGNTAYLDGAVRWRDISDARPHETSAGGGGTYLGWW